MTAQEIIAMAKGGMVEKTNEAPRYSRPLAVHPSNYVGARSPVLSNYVISINHYRKVMISAGAGQLSTMHKNAMPLATRSRATDARRSCGRLASAARAACSLSGLASDRIVYIAMPCAPVRG